MWLGGAGMAYGAGKGLVEGEGCRCAHRFKLDPAIFSRQELIEISEKWKELGLAGSCPYLPSKEELAERKKQYGDFKSIQKLKLWS